MIGLPTRVGQCMSRLWAMGGDKGSNELYLLHTTQHCATHYPLYSQRQHSPSKCLMIQPEDLPIMTVTVREDINLQNFVPTDQ
ncbi:hypothetical protein ABKN59_011001 [Abortiporus biennis]